MTYKHINFMGLDFNKIAEMKKSFTGFEIRIQINNDDFDDELFYFVALWITFLNVMTTYRSQLIINFACLWMLTCIHSCISKKTPQ